MSTFKVWSPSFMTPKDAMTVEAHDSLDAAKRYRDFYEGSSNYSVGSCLKVLRPDGLVCQVEHHHE